MTSTSTPNGAPLSDAAKARQPIIDRYADGGLILMQAAFGLTPELATAHPGPGLWSPAELIAHLVDADLVHAERMKRVIAEDNPTLPNMPENRWLDGLKSGQMPVDAAATLFHANRVWLTAILRAADDAAFSRIGTHSEVGRQTLAELLVKSVHHLDHHLKFLYAKRANLGVAIYPRYAANPGF